MTINLKLSGQTLTAVTPRLAEKSVGKLFCSVAADTEWEGLTIRLIFRSVNKLGAIARQAVVTDRTAVAVPADVIRQGYLYINAVGVANGGRVQLTTADMDAPLEIKSVSGLNAAVGSSVTPTQYDQLLSLVGDLSALAVDDTSSVCAVLTQILSLCAETEERMGAVADLETENKVVVEAINEVLSYLGTADDLRGKEASIGERLALAEQRLDDGPIVAVMQVPIASASSTDGAAYTASGNGLPTVATGETADDGRHEGKGAQIIFIQRDGAANSTTAPTLSLNGGEAIPIRFRTALSQGYDDRAPDATTSVPVGALMNDVPYTMTFCGKYWLIDSASGFELSCAADADEARMMRAFSAKLYGLTDSDGLFVPIVNTTDGITTEMGAATIERTQSEIDEPDAAGIVSIPSTAKVQEMIDAALRQAAGGDAQQ